MGFDVSCLGGGVVTCVGGGVDVSQLIPSSLGNIDIFKRLQKHWSGDVTRHCREIGPVVFL